jgi:hypothetical protein
MAVPPGPRSSRIARQHFDLFGLANFCKDAGDFYAGLWHPFAAWQVFDLGRFMANHQSGDLLGQVDKLEAAVETGMPTLF